MVTRQTQGHGSFASLAADEPFPGVSRQLITTTRATVSRYVFEPGAEFPLHSHPQEQITLIESGSVEMTVEAERTPLEGGAWSVVAPGVEHGITAGPGGATVVAIISPPRGSADDYDLSAGGNR